MSSSNIMEEIGWKVRGDFEPPESNKRRPFWPRFKQILEMIPMVLRFIIFATREWLNGRRPFIDVFSQLKHYKYTGVPIGGMGCGSIGSDFRGAFNKFSLIPGLKEQKMKNIKANQFILTVHSVNMEQLLYQTLLTCADFDSSTLSLWKSNISKENVKYRGLFPRAWREFRIPELGLVLICEQLSPIIPHDYKNSSLPVSNFIWTVINETGNNYAISITFTFRNGTGNRKWDKEGNCRIDEVESELCRGISLHHTIKSMKVTYALVAKKDLNLDITCDVFKPISKNGKQFWNQLSESGKIGSYYKGGLKIQKKELGIAVSSRFITYGNTSKTIQFTLIWHMPVVHFGLKTRKYMRFYTRYFGTGDSVITAVANHATTESNRWRTEIEKWQAPILQNEQLPEWYRSAIFNELYYVCDGSTVWFDFDSSWKEFEPEMSDLTSCQLMKYGRFGYMESWEYYMFNTYDVHFYASWALLENWPQLEMSIQLNFCDEIYRTENKQAITLKEGICIQTKKYARTPHDVGHPFGEPWSETNAYILHDTGEWRDLNLKFILLCWRDWKMIALKEMDNDEAENLLRFFYERSKVIINRALSDWDIDGDGMIENSGIADQTYDVWTMSGTSAYCGSLWLAALSVAVSMADKLKVHEESAFFKDILSKAKFAFNNKLWNGKYFDFDEDDSNKGTIMADQLCGVWFQTMVGGDAVLSENQINSSLNTIYNMNVCSFADGKMGPVNGIKESGIVDTSSIQSEEVWTGIAYSIASFLISKGMIQEGFQTAHGIFESCWNRFGLQYQTPEAIYEKRYYRAIGYMRPLSIWSMQHAIQKKISL